MRHEGRGPDVLSTLESRLAPYRGSRDDPAPPDEGALAAVAAVLRPAGQSVELLLIERAELDDDPWSGHMALPGGRHSPEDGSLLDTAMREAHEETGVRLSRRGQLLGRLGVIQPESLHLPRLSVLPLVFSVPATTSVERAPAEVSDALWVPVADLGDPVAQTVYRLQREGGTLTFPALAVGDRRVWGMTRRILLDLLDRLD